MNTAAARSTFVYVTFIRTTPERRGRRCAAPHGRSSTDSACARRAQFFKKEACDKPTPQGFDCTFDWQVASSNLGASMYNNINRAFFYKDKESGKWAMRPPF